VFFLKGKSVEFNINNKNITILIADDEPTNRLVAKIALQKEGYTLLEATNGIEAVELAKEYVPDVILMDAMMPKMDGFEAIKEIKKIENLQSIPILMITALDSKEDKIRAFESGANDFLNKPFDMYELVLRVRSFVKMRYLYLQNLKARIDPTYNLPNLQALRDEVETALYPVGIFFQIKDYESLVYLYGIAGTKIILEDMLNYVVKNCEVEHKNIYVISEDRFAVYWDNLEEIDLELLEYFSKKIYKSINAKTFGNDIFKNDLKIIVVGNSIKENFVQVGLLSLKETLRKNKTCVISNNIYQEMTKNIEHTIEMIEFIDRAIIDDRIIPVYQPILDTKTNKVVKYESLVRIKKEDGSLLSPYFFLDIAKQSDQYDTITKTMISKTFEYMKDKDCEFSINLSSIDIENSKLLDFLFSKLREYKIHNRLIIELLEDEVIHNFDEVLRFMKELKVMGVKVAIDDYGSGYSNLERIFQFEPDFIKIDGSIIKGIVEDKTKQAITKSAVFLAKEIGVKTVAEFVADKDIFDKCKELGVDFLQGYYISPPKEKILDNHIFTEHK
jgi:EAL domain-containing protein (putative c-di-GMP-specific phosphodiesterase class I)/DNA-binding response OmpR family regulator